LRRSLGHPRLLDIVEIKERKQGLLAIYDMLDSFEKYGVDVISGVRYVSVTHSANVVIGDRFHFLNVQLRCESRHQRPTCMYT
jgi:glycosylphosphatidylinositol transamidase (GPIT) subunit GPI8